MQSKREVDGNNLRDALDFIRSSVTGAVTAHFATSDQNDGYGFFLSEVSYTTDSETVFSASQDLDLTVWRTVTDAVDDLVTDIEWDGVMHESDQGCATFNL